MLRNLLLSMLLSSVVISNVIAAEMPDIPAINPDEGRLGEVRRVDDPTEFKVCADPDNMPYSNSKQEGFEDKIAEVLAKELGKKLSYQYAYYRQGFLRNTLNANRCDYVMSTTSDNDSMRTSVPYYRSGYVFVYRKSSGYNITDWNAPDLRKGIIGIIGQSPPTRPLADNNLMGNARPYRLQRDLNFPPSQLIDDLAKGDIDVAIVWGPIAGYFVKKSSVPLVMNPIPEYEDKNVKGKENWNISIGVRNKDKARAEALNKAIANRQADIDKILEEYGIPHSPVVVGDSLEKKAREKSVGEKVDKPI
ncbi:MAG: quinoprotein dehydrogenase-associated putative ABC transporter substrate-binding protein [Candidatus Methylopumilus sp.]|jgi:mxaJ protein|nr:quinoprotein dehydrogenase-associated putative ABC transporter substrate-binding protein [Candidatus Methylopumilus sp.]